MAYNVNTDLIKGNNLMIYVDAKPIAFAKSSDLSISADSIDTSNKMSGNFKSALQGVMSWTVSSDFLFTNQPSAVSGSTSYDTLMAVMLSGGTVTTVMGVSNPTTFAMTTGLYSGTASITSLNLKADEGGVASCSVSFQGSGPLVKI